MMDWYIARPQHAHGNTTNHPIFFYITAHRPDLGPTQPPIYWVPGALSLGVKRQGL